MGFASLSLAASAVYLINDVLDKPHDQVHPSKKYRAIAAGRVSSLYAMMGALVLMVSANIVAFGVSTAFVFVVWIYICLALAYSVWLKRKVVADVVVLAVLFVLRIVAGAVIASVPVSAWLLVLSFFLFLSIAAGKRTTELMSASSVSPPHPGLSGRGYLPQDLPIIQQVGLASGFSTALGFGLFVDSAGATGSYSLPDILWFGLPLWVFWILRFWILLNRGLVKSDPVDFVVRDFVSYTVVLSMIVIVLAAQ